MPSGTRICKHAEVPSGTRLSVNIEMPSGTRFSKNIGTISVLGLGIKAVLFHFKIHFGTESSLKEFRVHVKTTLIYIIQLSLHQTSKARYRILQYFTSFVLPAGNSPNLGMTHHLEMIQISRQPTSHSGLALVLPYPMFCWYQFYTLVW